ncbi:MAG: RlmE family RNA methyltransferase [Treponema sp.]|jgi:23S rRNA (uridine2552-2'-O)-methyltransferase|nr:RlmE family RNA methyltransferase [Treponema sp.]
MAKYSQPDFWSLKARKEGYPARSVYKLKEIDEKFGVFKRFRGKTLDLGAAPGSWSLYTLRRVGAAGSLAAIDLSPLSRQYDKGLFDGENFRFLQGDMTSADIREAALALGPFNAVLCDAAPSTTGNNSIDAIRSLALSETAFEYAEASLAQGGVFVVKVFQGEGSVSLLKRIRSLFSQGKSFKPQACRKESFETYYIGLGKKG